jgi:hypothetical protein
VRRLAAAVLAGAVAAATAGCGVKAQDRPEILRSPPAPPTATPSATERPTVSPSPTERPTASPSTSPTETVPVTP